MAARRTKFAYHNIELYKSQSLGSGSYGGVCKATCDGLLCAAKIMHPALFDLHDTGAVSYRRKFQEECHLLSLARHPNVVQYLATCYDPDTRLPVLLMELCDESLSAFLERSPRSLSYHIQLNICHDIVLALIYLHSNGLIHRDLTGNNVLMIAGPRAKITDFGMSKLASMNHRMTVCPGNALYMSPEALDESKTYTAYLDIFSFGVIVIQILTRQFPDPTDRFRLVSVPQFDEALRQVVTETERREAHLELIPDTHSLKPLVFQCLKKKDNERPSALQLRESLSKLKQSSQYREGMHQTQSSSNIQQLQQQLQDQRILTEAKTREVEEHQTRITELVSMVEDKKSELQANQLAAKVKDRELQVKDRQLQEHQHTLQMNTRQLQEKQDTISGLEIKILQLEQQDTASRHQAQGQPVTAPHTSVAAAQKNISEMTWRVGKNAPEKMHRGAAVVHGNTAYFRPANSRIYSYQNIPGREQWTQLPNNPYEDFGLAVIDGCVTSVGGYKNGSTTCTLLSLTGGERKQWSEIFPPMPTARASAACVTTEQVIVVAGGWAGVSLANVEVMNVNTKQWTAVSVLPQKQSSLSGIVTGDTLYVAGGYVDIFTSRYVFACSLSDLSTLSNSLGSGVGLTASQKQNFWKEVCSLPVARSTLASFNGDLLAVGGRDSLGNYTSDVYRYDSNNTQSWKAVGQMKIKRSACLAVTLPEDHLITVGGWTQDGKETDSVEILN